MLLPPLYAQSTETILATIAGSVITGCFTAIGLLWKRLLESERKERWYLRRIGDLESQVLDRNVQIEQMRTVGETGLEATIVLDAITGTVREWSPGATQLLHWTQRDMLGHAISCIIPVRFRERHSDAMREIIKSGSSPRRGPHDLIAVRKGGEEIPVTATYSGWKVGNEHQVSATLKRRRWPNPDSDPSKPKPPEIVIRGEGNEEGSSDG